MKARLKSCLQVVADDAQLVTDLIAEVEQRDDRDDGDEREDECVLGETLTGLVVVADNPRDECRYLRDVHGAIHLPPGQMPGPGERFGSGREDNEPQPLSPGHGAILYRNGLPGK